MGNTKILLTGSTGAIGSEILKNVDLKKYSFICTLRDKHKIKIKHPNIHYIKLDMEDVLSKFLDLPKVDYIIHLSARSSKEKPNYKKSVSINVKGTEKLLKFAKEKKIKKFIYLGTLSKNKGIYSTTKVISEKRIKDSGLNYTIIKPSIVYGESSGGIFKQMETFIDNMPLIPVIGNGKYALQPLYDKDLIKFIFDSLESKKSNNKTYELSSLERINFNQILKIMEGALNKHKIHLHVPSFLIYFATKILSPLMTLPVNCDNVLGLITSKYANNDLAIKDFNFKPISFKEKYSGIIKKTKRVGIVGFGKMGLLHSMLIRNMPRCKLSAICDSNKKTRYKMKIFNTKAKFYTDYKEMIDLKNIDVVFLCTPPKITTKIASYAAEKGIDIFAEKPLGINSEEISKLVTKIKENNIQTGVGYMKIYDPLINKFSELIISKKIGDVKSIESSIFLEAFNKKQKKDSSWKFNKSISGGGVVIDLGIHLLALFTNLFGKPEKIEKKLRSVYSNLEDEAKIKLYYKTNLRINLEVSQIKKGYKTLEIEISAIGKKGTLKLTKDRLVYKSGKKRKVWNLKNINPKEAIYFQGYDYYLQDKRFIDSLFDKKEVINSFENSLTIHEIIDKIYDDGEI